MIRWRVGEREDRIIASSKARASIGRFAIQDRTGKRAKHGTTFAHPRTSCPSCPVSLSLWQVVLVDIIPPPASWLWCWRHGGKKKIKRKKIQWKRGRAKGWDVGVAGWLRATQNHLSSRGWSGKPRRVSIYPIVQTNSRGHFKFVRVRAGRVALRTDRPPRGGMSAKLVLSPCQIPCSIAVLLEGVQSLGLRHIASPKPSECHRSLIFIVHRSGAVITSVVGWLPLGAVFSGFTPGPGSTMAGRKQGERSQNFPLVSQRRKMPSWQYLGVGMGWTIK